MAYHTKVFIQRSLEDRSKVIERMTLVTERLENIEKQQSSVRKELQQYLEYKRNNAIDVLSKYLTSPDVVKQYTSWTLDDVPNSDDTRSKKEIEDFYKPLHERILQLGESVALFGIKEVRTDISCSDLEWNHDASSLLGRGMFASVYRGKLKLRKGEQPVALKVWKEELNRSNACAFFAETEFLR